MTGAITLTSVKQPIIKHGLAFGFVGLGGAVTGAIVGKSAKAALTGALSHWALYGLLVAIFGPQMGLAASTVSRAAYGAAGLGSAALVFKRMKRGVRA